MRVIIQLKPEDSSGRGGDILRGLGLHPSEWTPDTFSGSILYMEPDAVVSPTLVVRRFYEALRDADITPVRVRTEIRDQTGSFVSGSVCDLNQYELDGSVDELGQAISELMLLPAIQAGVLEHLEEVEYALRSDSPFED